MGALVYEYTLEDLLTNEDHTSVMSPEEREQAMRAFEGQRYLENNFMKEGYAASTARLMGMSDVRCRDISLISYFCILRYD